MHYINICAAQLHTLAPFAVIALSMSFLKFITPKQRDTYLAVCLIGASTTALFQYFIELAYGIPLAEASFIKALPLVLSIALVSIMGTIAALLSIILIFSSLRNTVIKHFAVAFSLSYLLVNASLAILVPRICHHDVYIQHQADVIKPTR